jgi:diguanylate cyclase (GGDEF)-like protein
MSFRGRLRLFFAIIVIVPMIAVAIVLFTLSEQSETGKADAGIAAGLRSATSLYRAGADQAEPDLRRAARDRRLHTAIAAGRTRAARSRMAALLEADPGLVSIELYDRGGRLLARAGSAGGVAPRAAPLLENGERAGILAVSRTLARGYASDVKRLSGLEASVTRGGRTLASTLPEVPPRGLGDDSSRDVDFDGETYRGRARTLRGAPGPPVEVAVFQRSDQLKSAVSDNRRMIFAILLVFFLVALMSSAFISRALQDQIHKFLSAARRLGSGDFEQPVPTDGGDEFAALGREFNNMSVQLASKIDEVQRKHRELEYTIRRVGDAFATGLDRQGVVDLTVQTAIDACEADAGRVFPVEPGVFAESRAGSRDQSLLAALEAAERAAFVVVPEVGRELLEPVAPDSPPPAQRTATPASAEGAFALAMPMRARLGSRLSAQYVGVVSISRYGREFSHAEEKLLEYLAAQAVVSVENTDLHQTVQRQAVTDELTGLWNVRQLHDVLDHELERARRFNSSLGLTMLDIDDFKQVNDSYGHQQGDQVLAAVARVLREFSRDIDTPARYGGEEMAVVLPQTDSEGAVQLAERMREAVEKLRVPRLDGSGHLLVTASFGVASIPDSASEKESLIGAADAALYRAKRAGKNRVERAEPVAAPR